MANKTSIEGWKIMDIEIKRQVIHATGIFTILLIQIFGRFLAAIFVLTIAAAFWTASYYRLNKQKMKLKIIPKELEKMDAFIAKEFERPKEFPMKGAISFYMGAFLAIALFPKSIAMAAIIVLAISDSSSTIWGKFYGKHKIPFNKNKSFEGSIAFLIPAFIILSFFVNMTNAILISLVATFVEMLPKLEDNITIPIAIGVLLSLA